MKLELLILCNLMFQYERIICTKHSETEEATSSKVMQHNAYLIEPPEKRFAYEKLYQETCHQSSENVRLWPALEKKSPNQLVLIAQHLVKCVGKNELTLQADMDYKILTYPLRHYRHQTVAMLRCKFKNNVYRFIEGDENYCAFLVTKTSSTNIRFFISGACIKSMIPYLDFHDLKGPADRNSETITDSQASEPVESLLEPPQRRLVYEKLYQERRHRSLGKVRLWSALSNKSSDQLNAFSHHLAACIGVRNYVQYVDIDYKILTYPLRHYRPQTVAMIKCKMGENVYRFIEGNENYYTFLVLNTPSSNERFFIAAACQKSIIPDLEFYGTDLDANTDHSGSKMQLEFQGQSKEIQIRGANEVNMEDENILVKELKCKEPLEKLLVYEKMHHNKYSYNDFSKYKSWPLIEKKSIKELFNIAKTFATCVGIDEPIENMFVKEEERLMQYSIKNYKAIFVKMLGCHQSGKRSYYFVSGVGDYTSFLVIRMGHHKRQKLFIAAACIKNTVLFKGINEPKDNCNTKPTIPKIEPGYDDDEKENKKRHLIQFI